MSFFLFKFLITTFVPVVFGSQFRHRNSLTYRLLRYFKNLWLADRFSDVSCSCILSLRRIGWHFAFRLCLPAFILEVGQIVATWIPLGTRAPGLNIRIIMCHQVNLDVCQIFQVFLGRGYSGVVYHSLLLEPSQDCAACQRSHRLAVLGSGELNSQLLAPHPDT